MNYQPVVIIAILLLPFTASAKIGWKTNPCKVSIDNSNQPGIRYVDDHYELVDSVIEKSKNLDLLRCELRHTVLKESNQVKDVPAFIMAALVRLKPDFAMANPGEDWAAGCTRTGNEPHRLLNYVGTSGNVTLLSYDLGGLGRSTRFVIIKHSGEQILDFWCGAGDPEARTQEDIEASIEQHAEFRSTYGNSVVI